METTTIEISVENWKWLSALKERPGDSFNDVVSRLRKQYEQAEVPDEELETAYRKRGEDLRDIQGSDEGEQPDQDEVGPEGMTMDAGEALFGDIEPADVPDDLDLPGSGETYEQRRETIATLVTYLQQEGTATKADFLQLVDADDVGYSSADSFWSNAVKGRNSLSAVDGVVPPGEGGHNWRYEPETQ
jgi:predicted CopG family antitoxin